MKRFRSATLLWARSIALLLVFLVTVSFVLFSSDEQPTFSQSVEDLLTGKSTDAQGTLTSAEDYQIPLAIAACKALKFQAVHKEIGLNLAQIEVIEKALQARISASDKIAWSKTKTCTVSIPQKEITLAGVKILVPVHFTIPQKLKITAVSPKGEAGTLFPRIVVEFVGAQMPVSAVLEVDSRKIKPQITSDQITYDPAFQADALLAVGTHTASVAIQDALGQVASASWLFTVGLGEAASLELPRDAKSIGSFSASINTILPESPIKGAIRVTVFETSSGERILQYEVFDNEKKSGHAIIRTTSLTLLRKLASKQIRDSVNIKPKTNYAFASNTIPLSFYYDGSGSVTKTTWSIKDKVASISFETPTVSWEFRGDTYFRITLKIVSVSNGNTSTADVSNDKNMTIIEPNAELDDRLVFLSNTGTGSIPIEGTRSLYIPWLAGSVDLVEGKDHAFPGYGRLFVTRSRYSALENENVVIENPLASKTQLLFKEYGSVEVLNQLSLKYVYTEPNSEKETYEQEFPLKKQTGLFGVYPYKASAEFKQTPTGVILGTSRGWSIKTINLEINNFKRQITSQNSYYITLAPPIVLAHSTVLPDSRPLMVESGYVFTLTNGPKGLTQIPFTDGNCLIPYKKPGDVVGGEIPFRPYVAVFPNSKKKEKGSELIPWPMFYFYFRPLTPDWLTMKAFSSPANLVEVELSPPATTTIREGQPLTLEASIVAQDGFGTGKIDAKGNTLNLLDGYEVTSLDSLSWQIKQPGNHPPVLVEGKNFTYPFEAKNGTGTYPVETKTSLKVKEKVTKTEANVIGTGEASIVVEEGLKIISPIDGFIFPQGVTIDIRTNLDSEAEEWKKIIWSIDGQPWKPEEGVIPARLFLKEAKTITIKAKILVSGNAEISSQIKLEVKPVNILLTPPRRVGLFPASSPFPLQLSIEFAGQPIAQLNTPVDINSTETVQVTAIDWKPYAQPDGVLDLVDLDKNPFSPLARFNTQGAATVLATVTMTIDKKQAFSPPSPKTQKKSKTGQTFSLPCVRSDLWGIPTPTQLSLNGHLPKIGIVDAGRTFDIASGELSIGSAHHKWSVASGFAPKISFKSALPGASDTVCNGLTFSWGGPNKQKTKDPTFVPVFQTSGSNSIDLAIDLDFADGGVHFDNRKYPVDVKSLDDAIDQVVIPASFTLFLGDLKVFKFIFKTKPEIAKEFKIDLTSIEWLQDSQIIGTASQLQYTAKGSGTVSLEAKAKVSFIENDFQPPAPGGQDIASAETKGLVISSKIKLDLIATSLDGDVDEAHEENPGAYIHDNIDDDDANTSADKNDTSVRGEDDLKLALISFLPANLSLGIITLKRSDDKIRVWDDKGKIPTGAILTTNNKISWDLTDQAQVASFNALSQKLWVEGYTSGTTELTVEYAYQGRVMASDTVAYKVVGANCGWQPNPSERTAAKTGFPKLIDCEWGVTGPQTPAYNCIAWSVGKTDVWYNDLYNDFSDPNRPVIGIDQMSGVGNSDGILEPSEIDKFYFSFGFSSATNEKDADVIYFSNFHAAKKTNCFDGLGRWLMFESKTGDWLRIEHVWDQISGITYGNPEKFYKR